MVKRVTVLSKLAKNDKFCANQRMCYDPSFCGEGKIFRLQTKKRSVFSNLEIHIDIGGKLLDKFQNN